MADDIFYERFPEELKGAAPRIWYEDGAYMVGMGKAWTGGDFGRVLMQYDDLAGAASNNIERASVSSRGRHRQGAGVPERRTGAVPLPGQVAARARVPDLQRAHRRPAGASNGHFYGVGLINWWDPRAPGARLRN